MNTTEKRYFEKKHIEVCNFNAAPELAEQAIYCLELVVELVQIGLDFQFKGGNSLLIILQNPQRFSIDVDIATNCSRNEIEICIEKIKNVFGVFNGWEAKMHRTKPWLPMASYYIFYKSQLSNSNKSFIKLDVQLKKSPFITEFKKIECGNIFKSKVFVELPLASSIVGDKLLTLGPNTLGIPIGKNKESQRLKHIFDISRLLLTNPKISSIKDNFLKCLQFENNIQDKKYSIDEVIEDIICYCKSILDHTQIPSGKDLPLIVKENIIGVEPFSKHLFNNGYDWKSLYVDATRVFICISAIKNNSVSDYSFSSLISDTIKI